MRDPSELARYRLPDIPRPPTVGRPADESGPRQISLDDAIRIALENSEVVRVLAGVQAVSSGSTIYDVPATLTGIDQAQARFDPTIESKHNWNHLDSPEALLVDPLDPRTVVISGFQADNFQYNLGVNKLMTTGGNVGLGVTTTPTMTRPAGLLNPSNSSSLGFSLSQPLLQGGGSAANLVPVVLARIDTERSYFQFKASLQELVRGVIEAYWNLVAARTDMWARQQQVSQAEEAHRLADARFRFDINNAAEVAQTRLTLANFRAQLIGAEAAVLTREAALRNILGLPPSDGEVLVPVSPPSVEPFEPNWTELTELAAERRPDLIELKLIIEADEQFLIQANNAALPRLDAVGLYRWNGLSGEIPGYGTDYGTKPGQFTDWTLGVTFSVPLGLRQGRATLRQKELLLARDRANLSQGLHVAAHRLAIAMRNQSQAYEQYLAYKEARTAARLNLDQQLGQFRAQRVIFLNVLQAITDWGNSVTAEATALTLYNVNLANLEQETGTILETHGVAMFEERYGAISPFGRVHPPAPYPYDLRPTPNDPRYPTSNEAAEQSFDLRPPATLRQLRQPRGEVERLPPPQLPP